MANGPLLRESAARFILAYVALLALSFPLGRWYGALLLPLFHSEIEGIAPELRVLSLGLAERDEASFELKAEVAATEGPRGERLPLGARFTCSTLLGHALQAPLLLLPLVAAWPAASSRRRGLCLAAAIPCVLAVELLDAPLVLLGSAQDLLVASFGREAWPDRRLIAWMNFLNGGGRFALALVGGVAAVAAGRGLDRVWQHLGASAVRPKRAAARGGVS